MPYTRRGVEKLRAADLVRIFGAVYGTRGFFTALTRVLVVTNKTVVSLVDIREYDGDTSI
jgi:hypothetical protein